MAVLLFAPVPALAAWSDATRDRMSQDIVRLLPTALARQVTRNPKSFREGWRTAPDQGADPAAALEARIEAARQSLRKKEGGAAFVRRLGEICRIVADADDPTAGPSPAAQKMRSLGRAKDFDRYALTVRGKAPVVFAGWADGPALLQDVTGFDARVRERAAQDTAPLDHAYEADGKPDASRRFDDRSVPFAIASLSWSRAVSDCANVVVAIWRAVGGDMAGTPWLDPKAVPPPPPKSKKPPKTAPPEPHTGESS